MPIYRHAVANSFKNYLHSKSSDFVYLDVSIAAVIEAK